MQEHSFISIIAKTTIVHTATYFVMGLLAFTLLDYTSKYADPAIATFMRQTDDPLIAAGPLLQVGRGLLFGVAFYTLGEVVFAQRNGWLTLWFVLVIFGIVSTFGPAPSSIEGMIYTHLPMWFHWVGLPELVLQAFLLAFLTHYWVNYPARKWLNWLFGLLFLIVILMSASAILVEIGLWQIPGQ